MWRSLRALFFDPRTLLFLYALAAIVISVQLILLGTHMFSMPPHPPADIINQPQYLSQYTGKRITEYNNYVIFRQSFYHLLQGSNLYTIYPNEQWDFYKYSPTFAFLMGSIAWTNDFVGLSIWNLINGLSLYFAIRMLPFSNKKQALLLWFIGNELLTSFSNTQSNGLMCALIIAAYACMQRDKSIWATLWLVVATFIKVYGAIGFCFFLFYPNKLKFIFYAAMWTIILAALPLAVTPAHTLIWQYQNWLTLMTADASASVGLSVSGWLHTWFGLNSGYTYVTLVGIVLFLLPFARVKMYKDEVYRLLILASMLIWVIIFNHKAESPTFIIAVTGVGIWYFASPATRWRTALLIFVLLFTSMVSTDFCPPYVKNHFVKPYTIKAVPCIIAWCVVTAELLMVKRQERSTQADIPLASL